MKRMEGMYKLFIPVVLVCLVLAQFSVLFTPSQATAANSVNCGSDVPVEYYPSNLAINSTKKQQITSSVTKIFGQVCSQQRDLTQNSNPIKLTIAVVTDARGLMAIFQDKKVNSGEYLPEYGEIYINSDSFEDTQYADAVIFHELTHSFQKGYSGPGNLNNLIAEGWTEYLTIKLYQDEGVYVYPVSVVTAMLAAIKRIKPSSNAESILNTAEHNGTISTTIDTLFNPYLPSGQTSAFSKINYALKQEDAGKYHEDIVAWLSSIQPSATTPPIVDTPTATDAVTNTPTSGVGTTTTQTSGTIDPVTGLVINQSGLLEDPATGIIYRLDSATGMYIDTSTGNSLTLDELKARVAGTTSADLNQTPSIVFTSTTPGIVEKKDGPVKIPFSINNVGINSIAPPKGYLVKQGQTYDRTVSLAKDNNYTFEWDPSQSDLGAYFIRIVVREKPQGSGAVGGKLLISYDSPITLVPAGTKIVNNAITADEPEYVVDNGAPKLKITGKVTGAAGTMNMSLTNLWAGPDGKQALSISNFYTTPVAKDGTFTYMVSFTTLTTNDLSAINPMQNPSIAHAYAADSLLFKAGDIIFNISPVGIAYNEIIYGRKMFTSIKNYATHGGANGGSPISPVTGPTVGTEAATGFGGLINSLKNLIRPQAGGDAQGELSARILNIINFLVGLASALLAFALVWTGLLYIFSMGNEEQATKAKKNIVSIITGLVVLLASFSIITIIRTLLTTGKL